MMAKAITQSLRSLADKIDSLDDEQADSLIKVDETLASDFNDLLKLVPRSWKKITPNRLFSQLEKNNKGIILDDEHKKTVWAWKSSEDAFLNSRLENSIVNVRPLDNLFAAINTAHDEMVITSIRWRILLLVIVEVKEFICHNVDDSEMVGFFRSRGLISNDNCARFSENQKWWFHAGRNYKDLSNHLGGRGSLVYLPETGRTNYERYYPSSKELKFAIVGLLSKTVQQQANEQWRSFTAHDVVDKIVANTIECVQDLRILIVVPDSSDMRRQKRKHSREKTHTTSNNNSKRHHRIPLTRPDIHLSDAGAVPPVLSEATDLTEDGDSAEHPPNPHLGHVYERHVHPMITREQPELNHRSYFQAIPPSTSLHATVAEPQTTNPPRNEHTLEVDQRHHTDEQVAHALTTLSRGSHANDQVSMQDHNGDDIPSENHAYRGMPSDTDNAFNQMQAVAPGTDRLGQPHPVPSNNSQDVQTAVGGMDSRAGNEQHHRTHQTRTIFSNTSSQDCLEMPVPYTLDPVPTAQLYNTSFTIVHGNSPNHMQGVSGTEVTRNPDVSQVRVSVSDSKQGPISSREDSQVPPSLCNPATTGTQQGERIRNNARVSSPSSVSSPLSLGTMQPAASPGIHTFENDTDNLDATQALSATPISCDSNSLPSSLSHLLNDNGSIIRHSQLTGFSLQNEARNSTHRPSHFTSGWQETPSTEPYIDPQLSNDPSSNTVSIFPRIGLDSQQLHLTDTSRDMAALLCLLHSSNVSMELFNRARSPYRFWGSDGEITQGTVSICKMVEENGIFQQSLNELQTWGGITRDAQSILLNESLSQLASDNSRWKLEALKIVFAAFPVDRRVEPARSFSIATSLLPYLQAVRPLIREIHIDEGLTPFHVIDVCLSASEYSDMQWKDECIRTARSVAEDHQVDHIFRQRISLREMKLSRLRSKWGCDIDFKQFESLNIYIEDSRSNAYHGGKLLLLSELFLEASDTNAALETLVSYNYWNNERPSTMEKSQTYQVKVQQGKILHFSGRFKAAESHLLESLTWNQQETTTPIQATIHLVGVFCELGDPGRGIRLAEDDLRCILESHQHTTRPNTRIVRKLRLSLAYAYLLDSMWNCLRQVGCNGHSLDHAQDLFKNLRDSSSFTDNPSRANKINQVSLLLGLAAIAHLKGLHLDALGYYDDVLEAAKLCGWRKGYIESIVNASKSVVQYRLGRFGDAEQSDRTAGDLYSSRSYFLVGFGTLWPEIIGAWYSKQKRERVIPSCKWECFQPIDSPGYE